MDSKSVDTETESGEVKSSMWSSRNGLLHELDTGSRIATSFLEDISGKGKHKMGQSFTWLVRNTWKWPFVLKSLVCAVDQVVMRWCGHGVRRCCRLNWVDIETLCVWW